MLRRQTPTIVVTHRVSTTASASTATTRSRASVVTATTPVSCVRQVRAHMTSRHCNVSPTGNTLGMLTYALNQLIPPPSHADFLAAVLDTDECDPSPCDNDAICLDLVDDYTCQCRDGYSGRNCTTGQMQHSCIFVTCTGVMLASYNDIIGLYTACSCTPMFMHAVAGTVLL